MSQANTSHQASHPKQILVFHFLAMPAAYIITSYFSNFYPKPYQFVLLGLIVQLFCGMIAFLLLAGEAIGISWREHWTSLLALITAAALPVSAIIISWQFPSLFNRHILFMDVTMLPLFLGLIVISATVTVLLIGILEKREIVQAFKASAFFQFVQTNIAGILLSLCFFITYFILAQTLNFPKHNTLDQYFDSDISQWITRLTSFPRDEMPDIRAVHPAIMLILRPLLWILSLFVNGNRLQSIFMLLALAGSSCVFLVWLIVKSRSGNTTYALVVASILGTGTSHLLLSSIAETYIFSAFALIYFCYLMQSDRLSLKYTIPAGVLVFGITITNLAQACLLYFLKHPRFKMITSFVVSVVAIVLLLNILQVQIFPAAAPLYKPSWRGTTSMTYSRHPGNQSDA